MAMKDALLPEFDHEMAIARTLIERVPEDRLTWRPHPKSYTLGELTQHVGNISTWVSNMLGEASYDLASSTTRARREPLTTRAELLAQFDRNTEAARARIAATSDAELMQPWSLIQDGKALMTLPRIAVLRSFLMNHVIHHRGQLSVYLRLLEVPVPGAYGPTADERG